MLSRFAWVKEDDEILENDLSKEELEGYQELGSVNRCCLHLSLVFESLMGHFSCSVNLFQTSHEDRDTETSLTEQTFFIIWSCQIEDARNTFFPFANPFFVIRLWRFAGYSCGYQLGGGAVICKTQRSVGRWFHRLRKQCFEPSDLWSLAGGKGRTWRSQGSYTCFVSKQRRSSEWWTGESYYLK